MTESKGRITLEYQLFLIYIFTKVHVLVLHFVKTINSNIIIQLKLKDNIFSMCPSTQHHLISSRSTHLMFPNLLPRVSISPLRILVTPNFLPCHVSRYKISFHSTYITRISNSVSKLNKMRGKKYGKQPISSPIFLIFLEAWLLT